MRVRDLLDEKTVKTGLECVDKEECFEEMVDILVQAGHITDRATALKVIQEREAQATTGIGRGIAVPHGKHESIPALTAALGTSSSGIEFDALDGEPVHVVFLLLASNHEQGRHLQALAEISRLVGTPGFYRRVVEANTRADLLALLDAEE
jgi:mannitol/fructose-specific phosphotransferase system IIA component (Ntr-type)